MSVKNDGEKFREAVFGFIDACFQAAKEASIAMNVANKLFAHVDGFYLLESQINKLKIKSWTLGLTFMEKRRLEQMQDKYRKYFITTITTITS